MLIKLPLGGWSCIAAVIVANAAATAESAEAVALSLRPNIVLILTDDQGYGDASCYGAADLKTPVMDAVAAGGVRFTRFRVNPLCAPTRASIMTGLYSLEACCTTSPQMNPSPAIWLLSVPISTADSKASISTGCAGQRSTRSNHEKIPSPKLCCGGSG
jgi:hypothetical protein